MSHDIPCRPSTSIVVPAATPEPGARGEPSSDRSDRGRHVRHQPLARIAQVGRQGDVVVDRDRTQCGARGHAELDAQGLAARPEVTHRRAGRQCRRHGRHVNRERLCEASMCDTSPRRGSPIGWPRFAAGVELGRAVGVGGSAPTPEKGSVTPMITAASAMAAMAAPARSAERDMPGILHRPLAACCRCR